MKMQKLLTGILVGISVLALLIFVLIIVKEVRIADTGGTKESSSNIAVDSDEEIVLDEEVAENTGIWEDETLWRDEQPEVDEELEMNENAGVEQQTGGVQESGSKPVSTDAELLNLVYGTATLSQGDMHAHADNDGRINETTALQAWKNELMNPGLNLKLDFVASLDHKQTNHYENKAWNSEQFIYGTEGETSIQGKKAAGASGILHYNMLFAGADAVSAMRSSLASAGLLKADGQTYDYVYNKPEAWFGDFIKTVQNNDGFFVIPHPNQLRGSAPYAANALGYVFKDSRGNAVERIGFEVIARSAYDAETGKNYEYWKQLLRAGYKYYACAGSDLHGSCTIKGGDGNLRIKKAITSVYTKVSEKNDEGYLKQFIKGNFTAGAVGIKMCIGDRTTGNAVAMGSECDFKGKKLVVQIGEFYNYLDASKTYRVEIHTEDGLVYKQNVKANENTLIVFETNENAKFYRVEVRYAQNNTCVAYGNPIWNTNEVK